MKLPSKIKFADEKVKRAFERLSTSTTEDGQLYKFLAQAFENLEHDAFTEYKFRKSLFQKNMGKNTK